jgi:hypothetical protein
VGPDKDCPVAPEVLIYPRADPVVTMDFFRDRIAAHGIAAADAAALGRGKWILKRLNQELEPNGVSHLLSVPLATAAARSATYRLLAALPVPSGNMKHFMIEARTALGDAVRGIVRAPEHTASSRSSTREASSCRRLGTSKPRPFTRSRARTGTP